MKTLVLHGSLKEKFGESFKLDIETPAEGVRALCYQFKDFRKTLQEGSYYLMRDEYSISEEELNFQLGSAETFHIIPEVEGKKSGGQIAKGIGMAILGVAIVAAAVFFAPAAGLSAGILGTAFTFGQAALLGGAIALAGVASLLTPTPKVGANDYNNREKPNDRKSFLYDGPTNTSEQGQAIPIAYGRVRVGSIVIGAGTSTAQLMSGITTQPVTQTKSWTMASKDAQNFTPQQIATGVTGPFNTTIMQNTLRGK